MELFLIMAGIIMLMLWSSDLIHEILEYKAAIHDRHKDDI